MSNILVLKIACRYIRAKCNNNYVSFLSLFSILATALGVAVLITVMSVMNGFDFEIKNLVQETDSHVVISHSKNYISDWKGIIKKLKNYSDIIEIEPTVELQSLLNNDNILAPAIIVGVSQDKLKKNYPDLVNRKFGIALTKSYATKLGVDIGDKVLLVTPVLKNSIAGLRPEMHKFSVVDIVDSQKFMPQQIVRLEDLQKLLNIGNNISNLNIKMANLDSGPSLAHKLRSEQNFFYNVSSWEDRFSQLFKALSLQKTMMFLILMLIIVIASFNMLSSMVMLVNDKQNSIAILKTLGMRKKQITLIFILQGIIVGVIGVTLGTILGLVLSDNVTNIVNLLENILGYKLVDKSVYMLDYLPVRVKITDIVVINTTALILSFLATIYPSIRAAAILPGKVLKGAL